MRRPSRTPHRDMGLSTVTVCRQPCRFVRWACRFWLRRLNSRLYQKYELFTIVVWSLCYNSFVDGYYIADTAMEPMFWFVDNFTRFFGPFFVFSVCSLLTSVVVIAYGIGVPYYWHRNPFLLIGLLVFGNWLLVNVVFHYYMAAVTFPGSPEGCMITESVSICKRCIAPKPPRTHHCSICNRCILKMDHHCPWLNTCIGHFNHRYFYLFCVYMTVGALFILIFGFNIIHDHWGKYRSRPAPNDTATVQSGVECTNGSCDIELAPLTSLDELISSDSHDPAFPWQYESWYHGVLTYVALLCVGVFAALGSLAVWHGKKIARGETSVETHINRAERVRLAKDRKLFINPYDFGRHNNWRIFLGLRDGRTWCRHVLLPSTHPPQGNGIQWVTVHSRNLDFC